MDREENREKVSHLNFPFFRSFFLKKKVWNIHWTHRGNGINYSVEQTQSSYYTLYSRNYTMMKRRVGEKVSKQTFNPMALKLPNESTMYEVAAALHTRSPYRCSGGCSTYSVSMKWLNFGNELNPNVINWSWSRKPLKDLASNKGKCKTIVGWHRSFCTSLEPNCV